MQPEIRAVIDRLLRADPEGFRQLIFDLGARYPSESASNISGAVGCETSEQPVSRNTPLIRLVKAREPHDFSERLLRLPEVLSRTGMSRSSLYRAIGSGGFPAPVKLRTNLTSHPGSGCSAWLESEVAEYIAARVAERPYAPVDGGAK
ncbi:MAG: AlpA family phage regulatory protein [Xanthomonadales bacterium]|nr:AlpA family phage regulatory protein [Xanthomonadales bacterium]